MLIVTVVLIWICAEIHAPWYIYSLITMNVVWQVWKLLLTAGKDN